MSKSTEQDLASLHGFVGKLLVHKMTETMEYKDDESGDMKTMYTATPADIAQAIKFLKDNDCTASFEDDDNLKDLDAALAAKREKRSLRLVSGQED